MSNIKPYLIFLGLPLIGCQTNQHYQPSEIKDGEHVYTAIFITMGDTKAEAMRRSQESISSVGLKYRLVSEDEVKADDLWIDRSEVEFLVPDSLLESVQPAPEKKPLL